MSDKTDKTWEQKIEEFVSREMYVCQTALVQEAFKRKLFYIDDIQNLYRPFDGQLLSPTLCVMCNVSYPFLDSETGLCEDCYEKSQSPQEIYEWWGVSQWLGRKLVLKGEPLLDNEYGIWWGRCISGQAIACDDVICTIYDEVIGE